MRSYFQDVPGAQELRRLVREFQMFGPPRVSHYLDGEAEDAALAAQPDVSNLSAADPMDHSLLLQLEGRLEEALELLVQERQKESGSLFLDYSLAMLLTRMAMHEPALAVFTSLLKSLPHRADFHYFAGYHAFFSNQKDLAKLHFLAAVKGMPNHSMALGFLGYLALDEGNFAEAEGWFEWALQADECSPFVHLRLGNLYLETGRPELGLPHLRRATEFAPTRESALAALAGAANCRSRGH